MTIAGRSAPCAMRPILEVAYGSLVRLQERGTRTVHPNERTRKGTTRMKNYKFATVRLNADLEAQQDAQK